MHRSNDHDNQTTEEAETSDKEIVEEGEEERLVQYNVDHDDVYNNKAIEESKLKEHDPGQFQLA